MFPELDYSKIWAFPGNTLLPGEFNLPCTAGGFGPCVSIPGLPRPKNPTAGYKFLLEQGQTGLSVAFDLPTQIGYDSDHSLAAGGSGQSGGGHRFSGRHGDCLFNGIPLDKVSTSMTINATAAILLAMYIAVGEKTGDQTGGPAGHDPERRPQGIRGPGNVYLSASAFDAPGHEHL